LPTSLRHSSRPSSSSFPITLTDDDHVALTLQSAPQRIVTWGPSNTEILFGLGLGRKIVGVSGPYDDFPPAAKSIAKVGGAGGIQPDLEKVVSLHPDVVLNAFLGGADWHKRLRDLRIPVFSIYASTFDDALHDIQTVGRLTGATTAAATLTASMARQAQTVQSKVAGEPAVSCFLEEGYASGVFTVGPGSIEFDLLRRAGCDPVTAGDRNAYPSWTDETLIGKDPAVYLVATESGVSPQAVGTRPGFDAIAAVKDGKVFAISSDLLNRPGPRVVEGLADLAKILHPDAFS